MKRISKAFGLALLLMSGFAAQAAHAQSRLEKVLTDQQTITKEGYWLYNDLEAGLEAAKKSGQPILVTFRCIPCEHCVKLDEQLIEADPELQQLLKRFVRVRQVSTNGLDLKQFQYDYDQSFSVMLMNADGTIYGRYGTRSDQTQWEGDVSIRGLAEAMKKALTIHRGYPGNRAQLAGKQGTEVLFETPNQAPLHRDKFPDHLQFNDQVVKNCIHCHMVGDAQRDYFVRQDQPIPDRYLLQYPHPKAYGLIMDPDTSSTVKQVVEGSLAASTGFQKDDQILTMNQQPIISLADMQWVLQQANDGDVVSFEVQRGDQAETLQWTLPKGWREMDDIAWRVSSWPLRRMVTGGMVAKAMSEEERAKVKGLTDDKMALQVSHVGQYGLHATAKNAGVQAGDIVVSYGGRDDLMREADILIHGTRHFRKGDKITIELLRDGKRKQVQIPTQY